MREGWEIRRLGDICEVSAGQGAPQGNDKYSPNGTPFVKAGDLSGLLRGQTEQDILQVSADVIKSHRLKVYPKGAILFAKSGMSCMKGYVYTLKHPCCVVSHLAILTPKRDSSSYLQYCLRHFKPNTLVKDPAYPSISLADISSLRIPVPPIAEQEKIVAELDCLTGIIDKKQQQLEELDKLAQSIFYEMFPQGLGEVVKLQDVCKVVKGLVNPNEEPYCNFPHIGGANIEAETGIFINVKLAKDENLISGKFLFNDTMVLYSKIRPNLNKVALPSFVGICSADIYPIIPDTLKTNRFFLKFILTQRVFLEYAVSHSGRANIPKINRQDLLNYSFPIYPLDIQNAFAKKIEAIEKQKELVKRSIVETEMLFNSRMDYWFN